MLMTVVWLEMGQEIEGVLRESRLVTAIGAITDFKLLNVGLFDTDINAGVSPE